MTAFVFDRLATWLTSCRAPYEVRRHQAVYTSEEAARARGTSLSSGAKALICKCDSRYIMFVMPANLRLSSKRVRKTHGIRNLRFASTEEVQQLTGLSPGAIPPFGSLFGLDTYCDERLVEEPTINFNAGDHSISISMRIADYLAAEKPRRGSFAEATDSSSAQGQA